MHIELKIDGEVKQSDLTGNMEWSIPEQINLMTHAGMSLLKGDLLLSGSPEGISFIKPGDDLEANMYDARKEKLLA